MTRSTVPAALVLALLAGCQAAPTAGGGGFWQLGMVAAPAAPAPSAAPAAAPAVAPAAPVEQPAPVAPAPAAIAEAPTRRSSGGGGRRSRDEAPAPEVGSLVVDLAPLAEALGITPAAPAARRLLATRDDVETVEITIKMDGLPDRVETVTRAAIAAGTTRVTVAGLPTGTCTIVLTGKDAGGAVIGTSARTAAIAAARATEAYARLYVVPDDGEGFDWNETLLFGVDLAAAPPAVEPEGGGPVAGTVLATYPNFTLFAGRTGFAAGGGGIFSRRVIQQGSISFYLIERFDTAAGVRSGSVMNGYNGRGSRFEPFVWDAAGGQLVFLGTTSGLGSDTPAFPIVPIREGTRGTVLALAPDGVAYFNTNAERTTLRRRAADGTITPTGIPVHSSAAFDAAGTLWANAGTGTAPTAEVRRYATDGTLLGTTALPFPATLLRPDPADGMWIADRAGGPILHVDAAGNAGAPLGMQVSDFCFDAAGNMWVAGPERLTKLAPNGLELGSFPVKTRALVYADGAIWAASVTDGARLLKIAP